MADNLITIFDSPLGINNVDDPKGERFQPASQEKPEKPFLAKAKNVDLYRDGSLTTKQGRTKVRTLTNGHSGWGCALGSFYADGGTLYRLDPRASADTVVQTGINEHAEISYEEVAGQVFWCNGHQRGSIANGGFSIWGLNIADPPGLSATSGGLRAGRYMVVTAPAYGMVEGGAREASVIDLPDGGGVAASIAGVDTAATDINVYLSDTNGSDLFYHSTVPVGDFVIADQPMSIKLFTGLGGYPPPAGHMVRQWGGFLIVATDDGFYFSEPGNPHRYHIETDFQMTPSRPVMCEPMSDGFFYALESGGTFWVQGTDPHKMSVRQIDDRLVSEQTNGLRVPASKLPWLQAQMDVPVPLWATQDGWAAGLPGGVVRYAVEGRVAMDANRKATMSYVERPGLKQILLSMRDKRLSSRMGMGDQVSISVTRGGVQL